MTTLSAEDIARYLRENPDFMNEHAEIFTHITVPHPQHNQAISLPERQLHALREKIIALEERLTQLIEFGEENDDISSKVHQLSVMLLGESDYLGVREVAFRQLLDEFGVPHVAMRIWSSLEEHGTPDFEEVSEELRRLAAELEQPYRGAPENMEIVGWFGEAAPHIRSVALIPLLRRNQEAFGLLALGSEEEARFQSQMGSLYLARIGDLLAAVLLRELG